jgi:hypothetical protein
VAVEPTGGKTNAAVKGAATAASVATVPGIGLAVPRLSAGKVSIEGKMLDSSSCERQVAFVTGKGGRKWVSGLRWVQEMGRYSGRISLPGEELSRSLKRGAQSVAVRGSIRQGQ